MANRDRSVELERGLSAYRQGQHYEAHEHWEELWHEEQDEQRSSFLQALIQIASAVHKARHDVAPRGAVALIDRALERLEGLPGCYLGIDVAALRPEVRAFQRAVAVELEQSGGHCRISAERVPAIRSSGRPARWIQGERSPAVPEGARRAHFDQGLAAYQNGEFFEAHELWEEIWRDQPEGAERTLLQGLIQVAAAMHKVVAQRKPAPAARLLERALMRLGPAPSNALGLQMRQLVEGARAARQALLELAERDDKELDPSLIPRIARARRN